MGLTWGLRMLVEKVEATESKAESVDDITAATTALMLMMAKGWCEGVQSDG